MSKFLISFSIFLFLWLPLALFGLVAVLVMLMTNWSGCSTWFGNYIYGRQGNAHTPQPPSFFDSWNFLALRNPVSNMGKFTLARSKYSDAWLIEKKWWRIGILYGWKLSDPRLPDAQRPFVFRPMWVKR